MKTLENNFGFESVNDILKAGCTYHHSASQKGYQSRKYDVAYPYKGKFGEGFIVKRNNPQSNRYGIMIDYYIKK